jgi:hypothetical protein
MRYETIREWKDSGFKRLTGVKQKTFKKMLEVITNELPNFGRPPTLSRADQLPMTLMYWREYRTQFHIAGTYGVALIQTAIRGRSPASDKVHLSQFTIKFNKDGKPTKATCPKEQTVPVQTSSRKKSFVAHFDPKQCRDCPLREACPAQPGKREPKYHLRFTQNQARAAERRRQSQAYARSSHNLRAAVEATVRSIKHPFPAGKLPVRGSFRMTNLIIASAAMANVRRIQRFIAAKRKLQSAKPDGEAKEKTAQDSFFLFLSGWTPLHYGFG